VFGLPFITNRISVNSEHDIVNVRLLSICPPDALRAYFQEGYLVGTEDVTTEYSSKNELDFNNRLIAKFQIGKSDEFWGRGFDKIPREALYPVNDKIDELCRAIQQETGGGVQATELGSFLQEWSAIESYLLSFARAKTEKVYSISDAIRVLQRSEDLPHDLFSKINILRKTRNSAVHKPEALNPGQLVSASVELKSIASEIKNLSTSGGRNENVLEVGIMGDIL
jgi:hypothetical protein